MLHKLRLAMVGPGRDQDKLSGDIEVDESYLGGPVPGGKRGRGAEGKVIIAIAVERKGFGTKSKRWKLGRARIRVVGDTKAKTLLDFVEDTCEPGSTIYTDGLSAYKNLPSRGFEHDATAVSKGSDPAHVVLPAVHRVASLLKRWLMGTHHGGWGRSTSRHIWTSSSSASTGDSRTRAACSSTGCSRTPSPSRSSTTRRSSGRGADRPGR